MEPELFCNTEWEPERAPLEISGDLAEIPVIRVQLPKEATLLVRKALQTLKERGGVAKADELLEEFLSGITESYLQGQVDQKTPDAFYFELAKGMPSLKESIVKKARKAFQRRDQDGNLPVRRRRKRGAQNPKDPKIPLPLEMGSGSGDLVGEGLLPLQPPPFAA